MNDGAWAVRVPAGYRVGPWTVVRAVASGSWGSVYEGRGADGQPAALKFLPTGTVTPRQLDHLREMARREVDFHRRSSDLRGGHARLVRCFDVRTVDDPGDTGLDGAVVIVMELAERSLAEVIRAADGRPVPGAAALIEQICEGLAQMHADGWVHGDLKPGNVLVMADGSVRLADFGLTAEIEGTHAYLPPVGSSDYTAPERWTERLGERGVAVRATGDIWALGVIAYQLVTGRHPFPGGGARSRAIAAAEHAADGLRPAVPGEVPAPWRAILEDCLSPTHERRSPHTAAALLARIRAARGGGAPLGHPRWRRVAVAAAVVAVLAAVAAWRVGPPSDPPGVRADDTAAVDFLGARQAPSSPPHSTGPAVARSVESSEYRPDLLRTGVGIPGRYRRLIVDAGTACVAAGLSPVLVAAMLKVESDFDANLSDPAKDEYGIARWTPRVLQYYLPETQRTGIPSPPFPPEMSIPAVGRYLCYLAPRLAGASGDPALLLAAAYRTSSATVTRAGGVPPSLMPHTDRVAHFMRVYRP